MNFIEAIKTCFKKYFVFKGRARRSEFWWWMLFTIGMTIPLSALDMLLFDGVTENISPLDTIFSIVTFIPWIAVTTRRLHDMDKSGWWQLLPIPPMILIGIGLITSVTSGGTATALIIIGSILTLATFVLLIVWWATDGQKSDNRFGNSPKYGGQASTFD